MATSLSLENDSSLAQGYLKVNGSTAATLTTSGITGNLTGNVTGNVTGNADTATKFSTTTGSAPAYACRAWVNFDGTKDTTGATSTANTNRLIRASGNVTSVLRNGTGDYTVNFATEMNDANYSILLTGDTQGTTTINGGNFACLSRNARPSTSSFRFETFDATTFKDVLQGNVAIFGN
jgi:hypothetical protein